MFGALSFFLLLLLLASLGHRIGGWSRLPYPLILIILGYVGSEFATRGLGMDTGVRWESFYDIIYFGLIPALIFHGATSIDARALRADIWPILLLAIPLMMLASLIAAGLIYWGIGHPAAFPWMAALLGAVLMSATDPAAVISVLQSSAVPKRILVLLEGESLFNDAAAIVLFAVLLQLALGSNGGADMTVAGASLELARVFFGGIALGLVTSGLLHGLLRVVRQAESQVLLSVACVWGGFLVTEKYLHMSGVMAVLIVGLTLGRVMHGEGSRDESDDGLDDGSREGSGDRTLDGSRDRIRDGSSLAGAGQGAAWLARTNRDYMQASWRFIVHLCESLLFLMGGITITLAMFVDRWLAMLIAIAAVLLARFLVLFVPFALFCRLPGQQPVSAGQQFLLAWSGVRGTMTLALALSLPTALEGWYTIQAMAYGVVVYTLFVQVLTLPLVLRRTVPASASP